MLFCLLQFAPQLKFSLLFQGNTVLAGRLRETVMQDLFAMAAWDVLILTFRMSHLDVLVHMDIIALQVSNCYSSYIVFRRSPAHSRCCFFCSPSEQMRYPPGTNLSWTPDKVIRDFTLDRNSYPTQGKIKSRILTQLKCSGYNGHYIYAIVKVFVTVCNDVIKPHSNVITIAIKVTKWLHY